MSNLPLIALDEYDRQACIKALGVFGVRMQMIKAIEELSELGCELARALNQGPYTDLEAGKKQADKIREETADVIAMLYQVMRVYGEEPVRQQLRSKMERLNVRIAAMSQEETE